MQECFPFGYIKVTQLILLENLAPYLWLYNFMVPHSFLIILASNSSDKFHTIVHHAGRITCAYWVCLKCFTLEWLIRSLSWHSLNFTVLLEWNILFTEEWLFCSFGNFWLHQGCSAGTVWRHLDLEGSEDVNFCNVANSFAAEVLVVPTSVLILSGSYILHRRSCRLYYYCSCWREGKNQSYEAVDLCYCLCMLKRRKGKQSYKAADLCYCLCWREGKEAKFARQ
jgi:hypothetical protein